MKLIVICTEENYFDFVNKFSQQKSDLAIVNPASAFLANILKGYLLETLILKTFPYIFEIGDIIYKYPQKISYFIMLEIESLEINVLYLTKKERYY